MLFVLAWAVISAPWLSGAVTIPYDAKAHFQAQVAFLAKAIHAGQSPFWTPHVFAGSPQIADPQSLIFSPALLLALITPDPSFWAVDVLVLVILGIGGLAIIGFFHDRGWHPAGALVAGLGFAFGASAAWRIQHVGQIESYAFFGVTLWLLARALDRRSALWGTWAGASAGMMVVGPDQVAFLALLVLAGYALDHIMRASIAWRDLVRTLGAAAGAGLVVVALPLIMTLLFASETQRADIPFAEAIKGSLHPASFLTFLIADLFGAGDPKVDYWGPSSMAWDPGSLSLAQNMGQMYVGAVPALVLLAFGLVRGLVFAQRIRFFTLASLVLIGYALGGYTPVFKWMYDWLPGVQMFRRPADATFLIGACLAIVGGYCVHRWLIASDNRVPKRAGITDLALIVGLIAVAFVLSYKRGHLGDAIRPIIESFVWFVMAAAVLIAARASRPVMPLMPVLLVTALTAADLRINNGPNESTGLKYRQYDILDPATKNETIRFLKERLAARSNSDRRDRVELVGLGFEWPNAGLVHGFDHTLGYNPLRMADFAQATGAIDTIAGPDQKHFSRLFPRYRCKMADMLGLRYIVSSIPIEKVDTQYKQGDLRFITRTKDGFIYENPNALPRVLFTSEFRVADFEELQRTGVWPDFDARKTVLLDAVPDEPLANNLDNGGPSKVSLTRYENTS
ncbi:MAG: hypothetical protein ACRCUX_01670, partial [Beijerinckiaceae bacterium]